MEMNLPVIKLETRNLTKKFSATEGVADISLQVYEHELLTLLGPSGCGKTTILRAIGGFNKIDSGKILLDGAEVQGLPPEKRPTGMVFQSYNLWPHMTIYENMAFGLKLRKTPKKEMDAQIAEMLALVKMSGSEKKYPTQLSGGQQQRVAIARALINHPRVLLLDEPLGALDLKLRKEMQIELKRIQKSTGITFIYVTHDQEEALTMSDTVVVMNDGDIQQIGTPEDIYNEPKNAFVADFIGESNIIDGIMLRDCFVEFAGAQFDCVDKGFAPNEPVDVVVRPEDVKVVGEGQGQLSGMVESVTFKGVHFEMSVTVYGQEWLIHSTQSQEVGSVIEIRLDPEDIHIMKKMEE